MYNKAVVCNSELLKVCCGYGPSVLRVTVCTIV